MEKFLEEAGSIYKEIGEPIGGLVFITSWVYCFFTYGFLLGFGLGWIPSILLCLIAVALWPLFIVLLIVYWTPIFLICVGIASIVMHWLQAIGG